MQNALDPETFRPVSPETHAIRKRRHGMNAICGACAAEVFDHSVGSLEIMPHFNHKPGSGSCPLKGQSTERDTSDHSGDGEKLRKEFYSPDSVQFAFSVCQALVCGSLQGDRYVKGNFNVRRFNELLRVADSRKKWSLKGFTTRTMPFALLANEVFDIRYNKHSEPVAFAFAFDKKPESCAQRRLDRALAVDPQEPVRLRKYFMNDDGTRGATVGKLAPGNPYVVSEQSAVDLAGANWKRLPAHFLSNILMEFAR
jgi:hypothetical protein